MGVASSARLLGAALAWRRLGVRRAGRALAHALRGDEQDRTVAGMGLVQAGVRSVRVLELELDRRGPTTTMVRVLADIGGPEADGVLRRIAGGAGEPAALAQRLVDEHDAGPEQGPC
jgi:hypothetical protein